MKRIASKYVLLVFTLLLLTNIQIAAQSARPAPELSVAGFRLGAEDVNRTILQSYSPRYDNPEQRPKYFFYNGYGNQVLAVTTYSKEHPFLVVAIEAFAVGESYQKTHYQLKDTNYFTTESNFFIGARQSATSLIFGVPNVTGAKEVIKKKGEPDADEKTDKTRTLRYKLDAVKELTANSDGINFGAYTAEYSFVKNKLNRFAIAIETVNR